MASETENETSQTSIEKAILAVLPEGKILELGATIYEVSEFWTKLYPTITTSTIHKLSETAMKEKVASLIFKLKDVDGNGALDKDEVLKLLQSILDGEIPICIEKFAEQTMEEGDVDGDGKISYEEYMEQFAHIKTEESNFTENETALIDEFFNLFDKNMNGEIDCNEITARLDKDVRIEAFLKRFDENRDACVSHEEVMNYFATTKLHIKGDEAKMEKILKNMIKKQKEDLTSQLKPGKYIITYEGTAGTLTYYPNKNEIVKTYAKNTVLEIIKIENVVSANRIRGQVAGSGDWVSIKNTADGFMWLEPILKTESKKREAGGPGYGTVEEEEVGSPAYGGASVDAAFFMEEIMGNIPDGGTVTITRGGGITYSGAGESGCGGPGGSGTN